MNCRLFSPQRIVLGLVLLAALVVGGLAWVSVTALRVEEAQRESAARADAVNRERLALWRLEGYILPPLGLENNRPYAHYFALYAPAAVALDAAGDPTADPGRIPSPLLTADLQPWMRLHFQLDPERGWESPQVIPPQLVARLKTDPFDLSLANVTPERDALLAELRAKFPVTATLRALAEQEKSEPDEPPFFVPVPLADDPILEKPAPADFDEMPSGYKPGAVAVASARGGQWCDEPTRQTAQAKAKDDPAYPDGDKKEEAAKKSEDRYAGADDTKQKPLAQQPAFGRGGPAPDADTSRDALLRKNSTDQVINSRAGYEPGGKIPSAPAPGGRSVGVVRGNEGKAPPTAAESKEMEKQANEWTDRIREEFKKLEESKRQKDQRDQQEGKGDDRKLSGEGTDPKKPADKDANAEKAVAGEAKGKGRLSDALVEQRGRRLANDYVALAKEAGRPAITAEAKAGPVVAPVAIHIGPVRARWLTAADGTELLLLVRAAKLNEKTTFQGVVLDWPALKAELTNRVTDLLPNATLTPIQPTDAAPPERSMTALPVQVSTGEELVLPPAGWTALRLGLVIAWAAALLAIVAVAFGGRAVIAMSERRIRFASAVTHELRTPLTALQLHLDLLNSGLITDEAKKAEYMATMSAEADRLSRLVENVLDFAKLEKRSAQATAKPVPVAEVLDAVRATWTDRLAGEGFDLIVEPAAWPALAVVADPRVVAQVLGNLIDNARKYAKASPDRRVWVRAVAAGNRIAIEVEDRGPGIPSCERKSVFRPFTRGADTADSGGAGLGLSLAKQWAELFGGTLAYHPAEPTGARFRLELPGA